MIKKACDLRYGDVVYFPKLHRCYKLIFINLLGKGVGFKQLKKVSELGYIGLSFGDKTWKVPVNQSVPVTGFKL